MKSYKEFLNESVGWDKKLIDSAYSNDLQGVKNALDHGANIHAINDYALRLASYNGYLNTVKYLVEHGANVNANDDIALRWASNKGYLNIVKYLIEKDANIHADRDCAIRWASVNKNKETLNYLCEWIIENEPWYVPKIMGYMSEELKSKHAHLFAGADMDLL